MITVIENEKKILKGIALAAFIYSLYLAVYYSGQPPLDVHSFRQTQTALTSYWIVKQGFHFGYETPVGGAPWAIPFEFPIYQAVVAYLSQTFDSGLDRTGRLVSYSFLVLTFIPLFRVTKQLKLPKTTFWYFCALLLSMPTYVYWSRTFMIETAALFFGIAAISYYIKYLTGGQSIWAALGFLVFATAGVLQKATTVLPILFVLSIASLIFELKRMGAITKTAFFRNICVAVIIFLVPIAIGYAWVNFTDGLKLENPFGRELTSSALTEWNWGTLSQRISVQNWSILLWERIFSLNVGAWFGVFLLVIPFIVKVERKVRTIAFASIVLAIIPLLLFINLHLVHDYYQVANIIFLGYGISLVLATTISPKLGTHAALLGLVTLMVSNYASLSRTYLPQIENRFTKENRDMAIASIIKRELPEDMQFVAFGNDWSSTLPYLSQRKSFSVPRWFSDYGRVISDPGAFLESGRLGAVVTCTAESPTMLQLFDWAKRSGNWKIGGSHGCLVVTPEHKFPGYPLETLRCLGSIDRARIERTEGEGFLVFSGWVVQDGPAMQAPDGVVLRVSGKGADPIFLEALKIPRLDVNEALGINSGRDLGFSRVLQNTLAMGTYEIEVLLRTGFSYGSCGVSKEFQIL